MVKNFFKTMGEVALLIMANIVREIMLLGLILAIIFWLPLFVWIILTVLKVDILLMNPFTFLISFLVLINIGIIISNEILRCINAKEYAKETGCTFKEALYAIEYCEDCDDFI